VTQVESLLQIKGLRTYFHTDHGTVRSVDGIDLHINHGECVALVGESGCGKSITSLSIMGLVPSPAGKIEGGEILFEGKDLVGMSTPEMRDIRGNGISMVFQEPMTSLNPLVKIGYQVGEVLRIHRNKSKKEAFAEAVTLLKEVGIPRPAEMVHHYPHQLSGGMRQRVMIAMAIACKPKLLIADEPTTAVDVTIQAQILLLLKDLVKKFNMSLLLISHDLGVVAEMCDRVIVMYAGKIVEQGDVKSLFKAPKHPYTQGLLKSMPSLNTGEDKLFAIPGSVPTPRDMPAGCAFAPRCEHANDNCHHVIPPLIQLQTGQEVRCWIYDEAGRDMHAQRSAT
jgi:peptide/nickel transport system ATP-binding protein